MSRKEEDQRRHAYLVMEMQIGEQRVIDVLSEKIDKRCISIEKRVSALEHWRTFLTGAWAAVMLGISYKKVG